MDIHRCEHRHESPSRKRRFDADRMRRPAALALFLVFLLSAFSAGASTVNDAMGYYISDDWYENDYFGFGFHAPGWTMGSMEENLIATGLFDSILYRDVKEATEDGSMVQILSAETNFGLLNINAQFINLGENTPLIHLMGLDAVLEAEQESMISALEQGGLSDISIQLEHFTVDGRDMSGQRISYTYGNALSLYSLQICFVHDVFLVHITITGFSEDTMQDALQYLYWL